MRAKEERGMVELSAGFRGSLAASSESEDDKFPIAESQVRHSRIPDVLVAD